MSGNYFSERIHCPACGATRFQTLYSCRYLDPPIKEFLTDYYRASGRLNQSYLDGATYVLEQCLDCDMVFQKQIPGPEFCEMLYKERPNPAPELEGYSVDYHARNVELLLTVADYFGKRPDQLRVFDFGFGWAIWASLALALGYQTYGSELTEVKKQHARSRGIRVLEWHEIPGADLHFINADWVFEHVDEPLTILKQLASGLTLGGIIKINVPNPLNLSKRLQHANWYAVKGSRYSLNVVHPLEHINCFAGHSLDRMASRCGLKAIKIPLRLQYTLFNGSSVKKVVKGLIRPVYRNYGQKAFDRFFIRN